MDAPDPWEPVCPERAAIAAELRRAIDRALRTLLKPREAAAIRWRFGLGVPELTLDGLGAQLGVRRERARQVEQMALRRIRMSALLDPWRPQ